MTAAIAPPSASSCAPDIDALALITEADYSVDRFRRDWPALVAALAPARPTDRMQWVLALERIQQLVSTRPESLELQGGLARLAMAAGYPGLTLDCLHRIDLKGCLGDQDALLMAQACLQTGDPVRAARVVATLRRRGVATPALHRLQRRIDRCMGDAQPPWRQAFAWGHQLLLEPLTVDHADDLAAQYRDPTTAALTGLPEIGSDLPPDAWVQRRLQDSPATYAWVHRRFGLVGYGDLYLHRQAGYLCMWVGSDFRGQGLGRSLVAALCRLAFARGLDLVLSSAYETNQLSIRSLRASRFASIPVRAEAPDHERLFFACSLAPITPARARRRLVEFCDLTGTGVRIAPGWTTSSPAQPHPVNHQELAWPST